MKEFTPWISDLKNGHYQNPVLFADYSDPDVIRVNDRYYMTASSFNCTPGLPVLVSGDMVNWKLIGHGIKNVPHQRYFDCQPGCGVWAPAIRFNGGKFYIVFPLPDEGLYVIESENPEEGWSEPHLIIGGKGLIDPCPFWDDDGKAYIVHGYAFSRSGIKSKLNLIEVSSDLKKITGKSEIVIDAMHRLPTLEGPKMLKKDGYYYISAPAGGVPQGWQMIFRAESIWGPWEEKTVIKQRGSTTNGPHQGSLLDDKDGSWWFLHFQDYQPWGRIVHLQPATWKDNWPVIGVNPDENDIGMPVMSYSKPASSITTVEIPSDTDLFNSNKLGLQWQWNANHSDEWYKIDNNRLELIPGNMQDMDFHLYQRILCQKLNAPLFRAEVSISFNPSTEVEEAGITILGLESARVGIGLIDGVLSVIYTINSQIMSVEAISSGEQTLFVEVDNGGFCRFGFKQNDSNYYMGQRYRAIEGRWIGARFGLYNFTRSDNKTSAFFRSVLVNR